MEVEFESRSIRPGSLIWSEDNILALLTSSILHIFAPSLNGALNQSFPKFSTTSAPALTAQDDSPPWRLMGDVASIRNAMSTQIEYIMASWSPTGCSPFKGCVLACITSKHSVITYIPLSSQVDKQWKKYMTMDRHIASYWRAGGIVDLEMADKVESVSLAWSPKILMGNIGSLLALGNKAGNITIWQVTDINDVRCVKSLDSSTDIWIIRVSWSPWTVENGLYTSILSFALADGSIRAHKVIFNSSSPLENIEISENIMINSSSTLHPCTVMRWRSIATKVSRTRMAEDNRDFAQSNVLAFSKGNRVNVWTPNSDKIITWRKPIAKAIADISWDTCGERLYVFFMDGKHSVLRLQDEELTVDEEYSEFIHQEIISRCHVQDKTNISKEDGEADNANADDEGGEEEGGVGATGSKLQLHIVVTSPFHMEFQRDRFQSCTAVLSKAHKNTRGDYVQAILDQLGALICLPNSDSAAITQLFNILDVKSLEPQNKVEYLSKIEALPDICTTPRSKLQAMFFDSPLIAADRVSIYLWSQLNSCLESSSFQNQLEKRASEGEIRIREHCTHSILKQFVETTSGLSEQPNDSGNGIEIKVKMKR
ncbi:hypothetical protein BGZ76_006681 [Entomortierella beljakovae]|nr:hypothetical protein BGZ76_006681 [Entomortierella beljakovae]